MPACTRLSAVLLAGMLVFAAGSAVQAQSPSRMKECADEWNALKAKNQTGNRTYSQFAKDCMAQEDAAPATSTTAPAPRTSVPSAGTKPSATPTSPAAARADTEADSADNRRALARCNAQWKDYKAKNNLTGAKAWHVFMARCLP